MDNRFSREKEETGIQLIKGNRYKRDDVIKDLDNQHDYKGITHYFTPDGTAIYSFPIDGNNNNNWNRPILTYDTNIQGLQEDVNTNKQTTRHVFFKDANHDDYEYIGTTTNEVHQNGTVTWTIQ